MNDFGVKTVLKRADYARPFDVNVLALFHYDGVYRSRVDHFKELGLVNRGGLRLHVLAVCSLGDGPSLERIALGWPAGVEVTAVEMGSVHPIPKINGAYLWMRGEQLRSRWELRVDDDSVTDVAELLRAQSGRFGAAPVHLMCTPDAVEFKHPLKRAVEQYLVDNGLRVTSSLSEYEASLTSRAAMERIYASEVACRFLADMAKLHGGPGDTCLAYAARLADVPTATAYGMYNQFHHDNMSITGGDNAHVHYVDWSNERFREMLWALEYGRKEPATPELLASLIGRRIEFGRCVGHPLAELTLDRSGLVTGATHENEFGWRVVGTALWLQHPAGAPTTVFDSVLTGRAKRWSNAPSGSARLGAIPLPARWKARLPLCPR